jgi:DNA-binding Lrp family transcriptional regulator
MITSIVMIKCETGRVKSVAEKLVDLEGVAEVYSVTGEWDIFAMIRVKEFDSLATVVSEQIASTPGITDTITTMAFRCYSKHNMEKVWAQYIGE